jgi:hypothetical protein
MLLLWIKSPILFTIKHFKRRNDYFFNLFQVSIEKNFEGAFSFGKKL